MPNSAYKIWNWKRSALTLWVTHIATAKRGHFSVSSTSASLISGSDPNIPSTVVNEMANEALDFYNNYIKTGAKWPN